MLGGYDRTWLDFLNRQMRYAFGHPWEKGLGAMSREGMFPDFPNIEPYYSEAGVSRKIQNTAAVILPRVVGANPKPKFMAPGLHDLNQEILEQFFQVRANGYGKADGNWGGQHTRTFLDGDQLGLGFTRITYRHGDKGRYTSCQHQPVHLTLWDSLQRDFSRAQWVAFCDYWSVDDAVEEFGSDVKKWERRYGDTEHSPWCIRIFDYSDIGIGGGTPTHAMIPGDLTNTPLDIEDNKFNVLPCAHYEAYPFPGTRYPVGRIYMQMATQEMLNNIERKMMDDLEDGSGFWAAYEDMLDPEDLEKIRAGERPPFVRLKSWVDGKQAIITVPGRPIDGKALDLYNLYLNQQSSDSGTTEQDQSNTSAGGARTATEIGLIQNQTDTRNSWSVKQMVEYLQRFYTAATEVARVVDDEPVMLSYQGHPVVINSSDRRTAISNFMPPPSAYSIIVDDREMTKKDEVQDRAVRRQELSAMFTAVPPEIAMQIAQRVNWDEWLPEWFKACGFDDPSVILAQMGTAPGMAPGAGAGVPAMPMPGMMPQGMPGQMPGQMPPQMALPQNGLALQ